MEHLSYGAVRSYLAAIQHLHISNRFPDPSSVPVPRLGYVLTGRCRLGWLRLELKASHYTTDLAANSQVLVTVKPGYRQDIAMGSLLLKILRFPKSW